MVDVTAAAYGLYRTLSKPIEAATAFETRLEDIGQKAAIPQERLAALGQRIRQVARDTNQAASQMAQGLDTLVGFGANEDDALALLRPIGRAATAYRASVEDLSKAGFAALDNLKVPANEFARALDAMAQAGKDGAFELRDMAQYFPSLGAAYQGLGQKGVPAVADLAAALQIVRKGAGDSSEAATNLANLLQKVGSPATIRAFDKMGINLRKRMEAAAEAGKTPIEAIAEATNEALKGDLGRLGFLFEDAQVQKALRPLIQNMAEYRRIREDAMRAQGVVEDDYARRLKTTLGSLERFRAVMENVSTSIGTALLPGLADLADKLGAVATKVAEFAEAYPKITSNLVMAATAMIGFKVAVATLRFAGLLGKGGALSMLAIGLGGVTKAGRPVIGFFETLALRARLATSATGKAPGLFARLSDAMLLLGRNIFRFPAGTLATIGSGLARLGWVGALAAGAGFLIYKNWSGLKEFFASFGAAFEKGIAPIQPTIDRLRSMFSGPVFDTIGNALRLALDPLGNLVEKLAPLAGYLTASNEAWSQLGATLGGGIAEAANKVANALQSIVSAAQAGFDKVSALGGAIKNLAGFGPGPGSSGMPAVNPAGDATGFEARAKGGPISAGRPYLVGERGPEIITPSRHGYVHPNGGAGGGNAVTVNQNLTFHLAGNPDLRALAREVMRLSEQEAQRILHGIQADYGIKLA